MHHSISNRKVTREIINSVLHTSQEMKIISPFVFRTLLLINRFFLYNTREDLFQVPIDINAILCISQSYFSSGNFVKLH